MNKEEILQQFDQFCRDAADRNMGFSNGTWHSGHSADELLHPTEESASGIKRFLEEISTEMMRLIKAYPEEPGLRDELFRIAKEDMPYNNNSGGAMPQ